MKQYLVGSILVLCTGCAGMMGLESPRPEPYQVDATVEMTGVATKELVAAQKVRVEEAKKASTEIVSTIVEGATETFMVAAASPNISDRALANMYQNQMELLDSLAEERGVGSDILNTDGLQKTVRGIHGRGTSASEIDTVQMAMHTAAATAGFLGSKEKFQQMAGWSFANLLPWIGGIVGSGGLIGGLITILLKSRKKSNVIKTVGRVIASKGNAATKATLAKALARQPMSGEDLV